ncbi:DUF6207 family protein [Streptomyces sp. NPDC093598]|uniref:DUF6207 family protein n=1 Tax=Streptomyces sp. NPDC093598 TaxID=3366046 RepID=UPI0038048032
MPTTPPPALTFQQLLAERWATATAERTTRDAGEPGVRLRCYWICARSSPSPTSRPGHGVDHGPALIHERCGLLHHDLRLDQDGLEGALCSPACREG